MIDTNGVWRKIIDIHTQHLSLSSNVSNGQDTASSKWIKIKEEHCSREGSQSQNTIADLQPSGDDSDGSISTDSSDVLSPQRELECLFSGIKKTDNACHQLFRGGLTKIFIQQLTDDAIDSWMPHLHNSVKANCEKFLEICVVEFHKDSIPLLDMLAMVFDGKNKFHTFNSTRKPEYMSLDSRDIKLYAHSPSSSKNPRGWLVDLINRFGSLGGFIILRSRLLSDTCYPTIPVIRALLRPFEVCKELLTDHTIFKYFIPIAEKLPEIFDELMHGQALQEAADVESIRYNTSAIIDAMKSIISRVPGQEKVLKKLKSSRLSIMLYLFSVSQETFEFLVNEVRDMTSPEDLDHFFECFQANWKTAGKMIREKLVNLIPRLIENDKSDVIVPKVLKLFWNFAHSNEISTVSMEQTMLAHIKIIDYSNSLGLGCNVQLRYWLDKCVEELKITDNWTLPALKQIRKICNLYESDPNDQHGHPVYYRQEVIDRLQYQYRIHTLVTNNLRNYMDKMRQLVQENPQINSTNYLPDGRYNHVIQVQTRLNFLKFILKDGYLWLDAEDAYEVWHCLVEQQIFESDRKMGLEWFTKLIDGDSDLNPKVLDKFFFQVVLNVAPKLLDECGFKCFKKFFKVVNIRAGYLEEKYGIIIRQDLELMGADYLWRIVTDCPEKIANLAIKLFEEVNRKVGSRVSAQTVQVNFAREGKSRLQEHGNILQGLMKGSNMSHQTVRDQIVIELEKMTRVAKLLQEHVNVCAWDGIKY